MFQLHQVLPWIPIDLLDTDSSDSEGSYVNDETTQFKEVQEEQQEEVQEEEEEEERIVEPRCTSRRRRAKIIIEQAMLTDLMLRSIPMMALHVTEVFGKDKIAQPAHVTDHIIQIVSCWINMPVSSLKPIIFSASKSQGQAVVISMNSTRKLYSINPRRGLLEILMSSIHQMGHITDDDDDCDETTHDKYWVLRCRELAVGLQKNFTKLKVLREYFTEATCEMIKKNIYLPEEAF